MSGERTVTVLTGDHGQVTIAEPAWCVEPHVEVAFRSDISHYGPDVVLNAETDRGPREILSLSLAQDPFTALPVGTGVHASVRLADGDHYRYDPAGLVRLADELVSAAQRVREEARRLAALTGRQAAAEDPAAVLASMAVRLAEQATAGRPPWNDVKAAGSDRSTTFEQAVGRHVVRLQAAIYTGERNDW